MQTENKTTKNNKKPQSNTKNYMISNMQTETLKSQIEKIAQKHFATSIYQNFNF